MNQNSTYRKTSEIVRKYDFNFRKRFGQNFLTDSSVLEQIVEASKITKEDLVIEIGPGIGTLTQYLCEAAGQVAAIEIDRDLVKILEDTLKDYDNVRVIEGDVLKTDLCALAGEYGIGTGKMAQAAGGIPEACAEAEKQETPAQSGEDLPLRHLKIVANLPYYITTPILMGLFEQHVPAEKITVMVQKEVAERMTAACGSKDYGSLSLAVQYYSRPHIEVVVPASSFMPSPKVDSAVVSLDVYRDKPVKAKDEALLKAVVRAAFGQRRKTLSNSLGNAAEVPVSRQQVAEILDEMGLVSSVRGETLTLAQFVRLADLIAESGRSPKTDAGEPGKAM